jgi:hypothetical protein
MRTALITAVTAALAVSAAHAACPAVNKSGEKCMSVHREWIEKSPSGVSGDYWRYIYTNRSDCKPIFVHIHGLSYGKAGDYIGSGKSGEIDSKSHLSFTAEADCEYIHRNKPGEVIETYTVHPNDIDKLINSPTQGNDNVEHLPPTDRWCSSHSGALGCGGRGGGGGAPSRSADIDEACIQQVSHTPVCLSSKFSSGPEANDPRSMNFQICERQLHACRGYSD